MKVEIRNINWNLIKDFTEETVIETINIKLKKGVYILNYYYEDNETAKTCANNETIGIWRVKKLNK